MIRLMVKENIFIIMELCMLDSGKMTNNMVLERKLGLMVPIMRDNMKKGKNMGKEN